MKLANRIQVSSEELILVYNFTNVATILNIQTNDIFDIVVLRDGSAMVTLNDFSTRYISRKQLLEVVAQKRQERAVDVKIRQDYFAPTKYTANSRTKTTTYNLQTKREKIECSCPDHANLQKISKYATCKHGYALLNNLGYKDMKSYLKGLYS